MKPLILILAIVIAAAAASAAEMREIELTDGTVIVGEVISLSGGVYTVKSAALGTIQLEESRVRAIRAKGSAGTGRDSAGKAESLRDQMLNDADIMNLIQSLQNDPDFERVLQDPEIMKAVESGDLAKLMANPEFVNLLKNRAVQEIGNRIRNK